LDLVVSEENSKTPIVGRVFVSVAAVVGNNSKIFDSEFFDTLDEVHWDATNSETSDKNFGSVFDALESLLDRGDDFVGFGEKVEVFGDISYEHLFKGV
jgi:hypothetical protein